MARIEDYALVGDLHSGALVDRSGSVDWLCLPRFDSPACFAALLDSERTGHWLMAPAGADTCTGRRYMPDTLVLETTWRVGDGEVRVLDLMPPRGTAPDVVRIVEGVHGAVQMRSELRLRFDDGQVDPWVRARGTQHVRRGRAGLGTWPLVSRSGARTGRPSATSRSVPVTGSRSS